MNVVEEADLDHSLFHCCGDEDLYPFGCPMCGQLMVFCYECDTLFDDLRDLSSRALDVNSFEPSEQIFACPRCAYSFEYNFMQNESYRVPLDQWRARGLGHLLNQGGPA